MWVSGKEMGVTDFIDSKACDKPVHEVHTPFYLFYMQQKTCINLVIG